VLSTFTVRGMQTSVTLLTNGVTYSMQQGPVFSQSRNSLHFMEVEDSLPHSHVHATRSYPEPARSSPYPHIPLPESHFPLRRLDHSISPGSRLSLFIFRNICFYGEELLAPRPTPKLEEHSLSAVRDCVLNVFAANLHAGDRSSYRNLRTRHAVVTHLSRQKA